MHTPSITTRNRTQKQVNSHKLSPNRKNNRKTIDKASKRGYNVITETEISKTKQTGEKTMSEIIMKNINEFIDNLSRITQDMLDELLVDESDECEDDWE